MASRRIKWLWLFVGLLLLALIPYVSRVYSRVSDLQEFAREHRQTTRFLESLQHKSSPVSRRDRAWNYVIEHVVVGVNNGLFSLESVPLDEMKKYRQELVARFDDNPEPTLEDLEWAFYRIREASPKAAERIDKLQPLFEGALLNARKEFQKPNDTGS